MNLLIDLDGVICTEEKTFERALAQPLPGARDALQALRDAGHQIVVYTARGWAELAMTRQWLDNHGIPYDSIHMGKPVADRIIDDRAMAFCGWPATLELLARDAKPDVDEIYLRTLRYATRDFLRAIAELDDLEGPVLEVGPSTAEGLNSPVNRRYPDSIFDLRGACITRGIPYRSLDIDPTASPDVVGDLADAPSLFEGERFGTIVLASCLEHMPRLFEIPRVLNDLLLPGGRAFALTPWNFRFHGPRPDCWRISDDGYRALFGPVLDVESVDRIACTGRPLSPIGLTVVLRRRADGL